MKSYHILSMFWIFRLMESISFDCISSNSKITLITCEKAIHLPQII